MQNLIDALTKAATPDEVISSWIQLIPKNAHLRAAVCLAKYTKTSVPFDIANLPQQVKKYLSPYYSNEHIYFIDHQSLTSIFEKKAINIPVDYSIMFDSNFATHLDHLVRGKNLGSDHGKILLVVDALLYYNLNFDHAFYITENTKQILKIMNSYNLQTVTPFFMWKKLEKNFRRNLVSLQIFKTIDCQLYKKTSNPRPRITYRQAFNAAVTSTFDSYFSESGKQLASHNIRVQRIILLILIKIISIQFSTSKQAAHKIKKLLEFMHHELSVFFDREFNLGVTYFLNPKSVKILSKVNKGRKLVRLLKKLDNIAWDMASARFMETILGIGSESAYFIPYFLTFDENLRLLYDFYRVKGVVFDDKTTTITPFPELNSADLLARNNCDHLAKEFFSLVATEKRSRSKKPDDDDIRRMIKSEYRILKTLMLSR